MYIVPFRSDIGQYDICAPYLRVCNEHLAAVKHEEAEGKAAEGVEKERFAKEDQQDQESRLSHFFKIPSCEQPVSSIPPNQSFLRPRLPSASQPRKRRQAWVMHPTEEDRLNREREEAKAEEAERLDV